MNDKILSRNNTLWMQGVSAFLIMLMHFVMQLEGYPRFFNIFGSIAVAVFLFVSGYGINESYKANGIKGFWRKRFVRVIIPCWVVYLFQLPFVEHFAVTQLLHNLVFIDSDLWFVDYILRWYLVYWGCRLLLPKYTKYLLIIFALYNIFQQQLYSEQAFSFFFGFWVSEHIDDINKVERKSIAQFTGLSILYGLVFLLVKEIPAIQEIKGTLPFNVILLNIKLPLAMSIIAMPYLMPVVKKMGLFNRLGTISYELYIVHYNFMPFITNIISILVYSAYSVVISIVFHKVNKLLSRKDHFIQGFGCLLYLGICYVLMCKYSMRATPHFGYICIIYSLIQASVVLLLGQLSGMNMKWCRWSAKQVSCLFWAALTVFAIALLVVQYHFDPMENNVDRWSAIANPIQYLFQGQFPYMAKTHLGGNASPFPVWLILHIPFYLLNNVGLSEIVTTLLFVCSVKALYGVKAALKSMVLLFLCINLWYEVAVRSDLISNFLLLATFIFFLQAHHITLKSRPYLLSVCIGLWLSTRLSVAFPLFILLFPEYTSLTCRKKIWIPIIIICAFVCTFLPLMIWDSHELFGAANNPFYLQSRQGNALTAILFVAIALLMAVTWKNNNNRWLLYAASMLLLVPVISFCQRMYTYSNWTELFQSTYDITYIDAAIPFVVTLLARQTSRPSKLE